MIYYKVFRETYCFGCGHQNILKEIKEEKRCHIKKIQTQ